MKRPAMVIVPAFIMGLLLGVVTPPLSGWLVLVGAVIVIAGLILLKGRSALLCMFILACLLGFQRQQMAFMPQSAIMETLSNTEVAKLHIMVTHVGNSGPFSSRYEGVIQQAEMEKTHLTMKVPVVIEMAHVNGEALSLMPGQVFQSTSFQVRHDLSRPADEPWLNNWRSRGFQGVLDLPGEQVQVTESVGRWRLGAHKLRITIEGLIDSQLSSPENQIMKSIFFGERSLLSQEQLHHFSRTGTAHLIAVSGLHVGILAAAVQLVLGKAGAGKRGALLVTMGVVWLYAAMTGFSLSILRAAVMYTCYAAAFFLKRRYDSKSSLLWCALIFTLLQPLTVGTVSFQLSFMATGGILWLYPPLRNCLYRKKLPVMDLLGVTLAAQLTTWPVVAAHFGTFSLTAIPANLMIIPMMGVLMPLALVMIAAGIIHSGLAAIPALMVSGGIRYLMAVTAFFSRWQWAEMQVTAMSPQWLALYGLALVIAWALLDVCHRRRLKSVVLKPDGLEKVSV